MASRDRSVEDPLGAVPAGPGEPAGFPGPRYSMTSSARSRIDSGTVRPSDQFSHQFHGGGYLQPPAQRADLEINRESRGKEPSSCHRQVKFACQFSDLGEEFPMAGTGNFFDRNREFFHRNREIDWD